MIKIGDTIVLNRFAFTNKGEGTGLSDCDWNEKYTKPITVNVIKSWDDYECGIRGWAEVISNDKEIKDYLKRNVKEGHYDDTTDFNWVFVKGQYIIYWSEFDILTN